MIFFSVKLIVLLQERIRAVLGSWPARSHKVWPLGVGRQKPKSRTNLGKNKRQSRLIKKKAASRIRNVLALLWKGKSQIIQYIQRIISFYYLCKFSFPMIDPPVDLEARDVHLADGTPLPHPPLQPRTSISPGLY